MRILFAAYSACGATHKKNDDRILMNDAILFGAEEPETTAELVNITTLTSKEIHTDNHWQIAAATTPLQDGAICIAFDGVGGSARGDRAARAGAQYMLDHKNAEEDLATKLNQCAQHVTDEQNKLPFEERGFTVAAGFQLSSFKFQKSPIPTNMTPEHEAESLLPFTACTVFNAGDSRTYRFFNKQLEVLTKDHTLASMKRAMGIEAPASEENVVTKFLGGEDVAPFDLYEAFKVYEFDVLFSCTDGFWEYIPAEVLKSKLGQLIEELKELADQNQDSEEATEAESNSDNNAASEAELETIDSEAAVNESATAIADSVEELSDSEEEPEFFFNTEESAMLVQNYIKYLAELAKLNGSPDDVSVVIAVTIPEE